MSNANIGFTGRAPKNLPEHHVQHVVITKTGTVLRVTIDTLGKRIVAASINKLFADPTPLAPHDLDQHLDGIQINYMRTLYGL